MSYFEIMKMARRKALRFQDNPLAQAILREGLEIQDRFSAEPIYAKTGKGFLRSGGVGELVELKRSQEREPKQCK
jgi:hypothetical protein